MSRGDLDDHKLLLVMEAQRSFDKPALGWLDLVLGDLDFHESDLTGRPPGEHIEEAAQLPVICGAQPFEGLHCPGRGASLGECPESRGGNHSDRNQLPPKAETQTPSQPSRRK